MVRSCGVSGGSPAVGLERRRRHLRRQPKAPSALAGDSDHAEERYGLGNVMRRRPIYASDLRTLGGIVGVVSVRDHEGRPFYRINHVSRGKDLIWLSARIADESAAIAGARILAEYVGAQTPVRHSRAT